MGRVFDLAAALTSERDKQGQTKEDLGRLLGLAGRLYRDALAIAAGAPELAVLAQSADAAGLAELGIERLGRALDAVVEAEEALAANVNGALAVERLVLALRRQEVRIA